MSDGFTFLEKAVIEHNMLAIGKIYENIRLPELASILMIDERRAEKVAATMITENRLQGYIDQSGKLRPLSNCCFACFTPYIFVVNALIFTHENNSVGILDADILAVCDSVRVHPLLIFSRSLLTQVLVVFCSFQSLSGVITGRLDLVVYM